MALQLLDLHSGIKPTNLQEMISKELQNSFDRVRNKYAEPNAQLGLQQKELANQYYGPEKEAHIAQMLASAKHSNNPLSRLTGLPAEAAALSQVLSDPNIPQEIKQGLQRDFENRRNVQESLYSSRTKNTQVKDFQLLPADSKINVLSEYAGIGIGEKDAIGLFNQGITPQALLEQQSGSQNINPQDFVSSLQGLQSNGGEINKQYPATSATRTSVQQTEGALAEEEYISPIITDAMKPYARKFLGKSPKQMYDALSSDPNKIDKVAKFYAARALQPEIAGIRTRMAGGSSAHEALRDIQKDALNKIDILDSEVSPEAYAKAQEYISDWIGGMTRARVNAMKGQSKNTKAKELSSQLQNSGKSGTVVRYLNGQKLNIPEHLAAQFDEAHR